MEFMVSNNGGITPQPPRMLEQGHAICISEVMPCENWFLYATGS